jgi:hypothetical protein
MTRKHWQWQSFPLGNASHSETILVVPGWSCERQHSSAGLARVQRREAGERSGEERPVTAEFRWAVVFRRLPVSDEFVNGRKSATCQKSGRCRPKADATD